MFRVVRETAPGWFQPETEKAILNASITALGGELREMARLLPVHRLDAIQRNRLKLALCEAIGAIDVHEQALAEREQLEAVKRVCAAQPAAVGA